MSEFPNSVMIALLPTTTDWCKQELPHMTLVYAGEIGTLKPSDINQLAKVALNLALSCSTISLDVVGVDVFGDDEEGRVDVIRLQSTPELLAMRSVVESWNASKHPFNPHVTVGLEGSIVYPIPDYLTFDRILVAWGDYHLTFNLM